VHQLGGQGAAALLEESHCRAYRMRPPSAHRRAMACSAPAKGRPPQDANEMYCIYTYCTLLYCTVLFTEG